MKRKTLIAAIIAIIISLFSVSYTFAAKNNKDSVVDGIRNTVGSAENMVENAGSAIGKGIQSGVNTISGSAKNVGNATANTVGMMTGSNNGGYTATRTSATTDLETSTTMYTWVIIGTTAVAIGVLLWSYFAQSRNNDLYIDSSDE